MRGQSVTNMFFSVLFTSTHELFRVWSPNNTFLYLQEDSTISFRGGVTIGYVNRQLKNMHKLMIVDSHRPVGILTSTF